MKTALLVLVLTTAAPSHITVAILGLTVSLPVMWLILSIEVFAAGALVLLAVRVLRRFRSSPWPRSTWPAGATS
jgi:hypothetical protein